MLIPAFIILTLLVLLAIFWSWSPGKPQPFRDEQGNTLTGSISEKIFLNINDYSQGMFIKGKDSTKPVLLYVHGGIPDYFLNATHPAGFEDDFVVVWWEQRGVGLSYKPGLPKGFVNENILVEDIIELSRYLKQRFKKEKIYLMGHSGGTFLAIQAAARAPELFHAYIGVAQIANQRRSEKQAYDYMLARYRETGNQKMAGKLEASPVSETAPIPAEYLALRDKAMHELGIGTMHAMHSIVKGLFLPSLRFREYSMAEKIRLWRSKADAGVSIVWESIMVADMKEKIPELAIPVYFCSGIHDYTVSYSESLEYFRIIRAPQKGFYSFRQSAHSPMFEEPIKMQQILREDVLEGKTTLADGMPLELQHR